MSHIAFDLGLKTTGICWGTDNYDHHTCPTHLRKSPITPQQNQDRYRWWHDTFRMILLPQPGPVIIESPVLHTKNKTGLIGTISLHGILHAAAFDNNLDVHWVENRTLKKWATGYGNANKTQMMTAARVAGWEGGNHDEADAYLLWHHWAETRD